MAVLLPFRTVFGDQNAPKRSGQAGRTATTNFYELPGNLHLATAEPKTLRYRLLHVAARLAFSARSAKLHIQSTWPWAQELLAAFGKHRTLTPASG